MWIYYRKCKYMFIFALKNLARKGLRLHAFYHMNGTSRMEMGIGLPLTLHYSHVIMSEIVSQITSVPIVCSTVCSGENQRKKSKPPVAGLCEGIPPVTTGHRWFPPQRVSKAENVSIWWRHHIQSVRFNHQHDKFTGSLLTLLIVFPVPSYHIFIAKTQHVLLHPGGCLKRQNV